MYDGHRLSMAGGVVVVTLNHRLNIFGYSAVEEPGKASDSTANAGQLDLVAALEWVRANIERFGGDASNVTVFGQSGGGGKICALMAMPTAQNLFHKAIIQSGSILKALDAAVAKDMAPRIYSELNLKPGDVKALRNVPTAQLLACYRRLTASGISKALYHFAPVIDGLTLPHQTWEPDAPASARSMPMLIGSTSQEVVIFLDKDIREPIPDDRALLEKISKYATLSELSERKLEDLVPRYRADYPELSNTELLVRIDTDAGFWRNAIRQADLKVKAGGAPVFMYEFGWKTPCFGSAWAMHGVELPFVFNIMNYGPAWDGKDSDALRAQADPQNRRFQLAAQTVAAWTTFARTGSPSTPSLPWTPYDSQQRPTMWLGPDSRIIQVKGPPAREAMLRGDI
jgi:para-nitrobenzyl esterase